MKFVTSLLLPLVALTLATLSGCQRAPAPPPFDVPALIGLPVAQVEQKLGVPATQTANQKTWTKDDATLTTTFKPVSGRVTELTLASSETVREEKQSELLQPGQLKPEDKRYSVDWIEAPDVAMSYNGVRIVPAPRTYKVEVRVNGPQQMLQVSYALSGANPPGETFLTIAPWYQSAVLADDATVQLSARLAQSRLPAETPIVAEILVDGKVVASKKASVVATCEWEL